MLPWFERPIIYDVRSRPSLIQSQSGSKDLQMVCRGAVTGWAEVAWVVRTSHAASFRLSSPLVPHVLHVLHHEHVLPSHPADHQLPAAKHLSELSGPTMHHHCHHPCYPPVSTTHVSVPCSYSVFGACECVCMHVPLRVRACMCHSGCTDAYATQGACMH